MESVLADFHTHSSDDPRDRLGLSTEMLIDAVAESGLKALAVTCHETLRYTNRLAMYARRRGVVLVPGAEVLLDGKHVVLLNPDAEQAAARSFSELRSLGKRDAAVIAPHPFYPARTCLWGSLAKNIDLFDAIEYCTLYFPGLNFNRKAVRVANKYGLPLLGTSDTHNTPYCASTCSVLTGDLSVEGLIGAIRAGRVQLRTRPRPFWLGMRLICYAIQSVIEAVIGRFGRGGRS